MVVAQSNPPRRGWIHHKISVCREGPKGYQWDPVWAYWVFHSTGTGDLARNPTPQRGVVVCFLWGGCTRLILRKYGQYGAPRTVG